MHIGTAAWNVPKAVADVFPESGSHLQRYAQVLNCCEINTSFYRRHRAETYARWAEETPNGFHFSVKLPRTITHDGGLRAARAPLQEFIGDVSQLGDRLSVLLVQLPPSLEFEPRPVRRFFQLLETMFGGRVVCEPRHASWFTPAANRMLIAAHVGRVAADPASSPEAARPGGWLGQGQDGAGATVYYRWHGSPKVYWSRYCSEWLQARATELRAWSPLADCWCIFDNTAAGEATADALEFQTLMAGKVVKSGPASAANLPA